MRTTLPLFLFALVGGAVAGALTARFTLPVTGRGSERPAPAPAAARDEALHARVAALEERNRSASHEPVLLGNAAPAHAAPAPRVPLEGQYVTLEAFAALSARVEAAIAGGAPQTVKAEIDKAEFAEVLAEIRKEESVEAVRRQQEKRRERLEADVTTLTERIELSQHQAREMRTALLAQYEREDEVRRLWEQGADETQIGERKRSAGEQFSADIARFLSADQVQRFWRLVGGEKEEQREGG